MILSKNILITKFNKETFLYYSLISGGFISISNTIHNLLNKGDIGKLPKELIDYLKRNKFIISGEINEKLHHYIERNENIENKSDILSISICPTSRCQFNCDYCGQIHTDNKIDSKTKNKILDKLKNKLILNSYNGLFISWFGSEPLLNIKSLKEISIELKKFCSNNKLSYTSCITTNGYLLTSKVFYELIDLNINSFQITIDGNKQIHDNRRTLENNIGTFDTIYNNLQQIVIDKRFDVNKHFINIRINIDERNYQKIYQLLDLFIEDNINKFIYITLAPIHNWENNANELALSKSNFASFEIKVFKYLLKNHFRFDILPDLKKSLCMATKQDGELFDALGNSYDCTELPYTEKGKETVRYNINDIPEKNKIVKTYNNWFNDLKDNKFPCSKCNLYPICGGSCPKHWYDGQIPCPSFKWNIEDRLKLYYKSTL